MSELRKDPISQRWVILSNDIEKDRSMYEYNFNENRNNVENCPFCDHNRNMIDEEIYSRNVDGKWAVRVVNNKFPALTENIDLHRYADGIFDKMTGYGVHEVIIDSNKHEVPFHEIGEKEMQAVVKGILNRFKALKKDKDLKYVLFFKNSGSSAGASLSHSHMQLIGTPAVPKIVTEELINCQKYYDFKERCLFCDIIKQELSDKERIIYQNDHFLSFVPYAPRFPYECWIIPKSHNSSLGSMKSLDIEQLSNVLKDCLLRLQSVFPHLPYNFVIHTAPFKNSYRQSYHWHIEIMPRLTKIAGFEWGSGFYILETSPEKAAKDLRNVQEVL